MAALTTLKLNKGQIITISSVAGIAPLMGRTAYSASKHGLHGFFESLRTELYDSGVDISMVCPSFIDNGIKEKSEYSINQEKVVSGASISPVTAANYILKNTRRNKRLILVGNTAKFSYFLHKWLPKVYEKVMIKRQKLGLKLK